MMKLGLICLLSCVSVVNVTGKSDVIGSDEPIKVEVGHDVILPCSLKPPIEEKNLSVDWERSGTKVHIYRNRKDDPDNQDDHFKGRTSLFHDEMAKGNISLKLTNVNEEDEGDYTCFVQQNSPQKRGKVTLIVEPVDGSNKGKQNSAAISTGGKIAIAIVGAIVGGVVVGVVGGVLY